MDWFYEGTVTGLPSSTLTFIQHCVVTEVWLKSKWTEPQVQTLLDGLLTRQISGSTELSFLIHLTRLAFKRFGPDFPQYPKLLERIHDLFDFSLEAHEGLLKLVLTTNSTQFDEIISHLPMPDFVDDCQDFNFISPSSELHIARLLLLKRDPFALPPRRFHSLFRESESQLISALLAMLTLNSTKFANFYSKLIKEELISVELFMNEAPNTVALFKGLKATNIRFPLHVRHFQTLLHLKLADTHPLQEHIRF